MSLHKYIIGLILSCTFIGLVFSVTQSCSQNTYVTLQMLAKYYRAPLTWVIPVPVGVDTSLSVRDSLDIYQYSSVTAGIDTSTFVRSTGNGTAAIDTIGLSSIVNSASPVDSFIVFVRADTSSANVGVRITLTSRSGTVVFNQAVYPTVVGTWQRKVFPAVAAVTPQEYIVVFKPYASLAHYIDVSPLYCKKR